MAAIPPRRHVVTDGLPWDTPPSEAQLSRLSDLNEQLDLDERYYPTIRRLLSTSMGVRRAIRMFEKYGTPKR